MVLGIDGRYRVHSGSDDGLAIPKSVTSPAAKIRAIN
jgi:hypothetical protein